MNRPFRERKLDVALQGGGAHAAFTWGVLERLLEQPTIAISALSGASAGAINAALFASGQVTNGREGAILCLEAFWKALNSQSRETVPLVPFAESFPITFQAMSAWSATMFGGIPFPLSPELGRAAQDLLRGLLVEHIDFDALKSRSGPRLFVSATDARSGRPRIFRNDDISAEALLASACLPLVFPPVNIDGVDYWDGGYSANPPLLPLVQESPNNDLLVVTINPIVREKTPVSYHDIANRITELGPVDKRLQP